MKKFIVAVLFIIILILFFFRPPGKSDRIEVFVVPQNLHGFDTVKTLKEKGFIKNDQVFQFLLNTFAAGNKIQSGGYRLSKNMFAWQIFIKITGKPDLMWVTITSCQRKEQVGEKLAKILGWSTEKLDTWNTLYENNVCMFFRDIYYRKINQF